MSARIARFSSPALASTQAAGRGLDTAVYCGALLLLLCLPLPFGGHRPWAEYSFALATFALWSLWSIAFGLSNRKPDHLDRGIVAMLLLWVGWLAWVCVQTMAWPAAWVAAWSPHRFAQARSASQFLALDAPTSLSPSLDVTLGRSQALLSASYAALFMLVAVGLRERRRFRWLLWVLVLSGMAQALYGSIMVLSGIEYGAWGAKQAYRGFATGTFVNRNHFAGYLELCIAAAVGLIVARPMPRIDRRGWRERLRHWMNLAQDSRVFARVAIGVFFIALILSQSRMGSVAAVGGICVASLGLLLARRRGGPVVGLLLVGSVLIIDVWLFGRWFGLEHLAERYATVTSDAVTRLNLLEDIRRMIPAYAWTGSGLGTFMLAYPEFRSPEVLGLAEHAHNDYAQFLIETGVVGFTLIGGLVALTLRRAILILRRRRDSLAQGVAAAALTAIGAIAIHSAADFNLQIPANAVTLLALMAAVWACSMRPSQDHTRANGADGITP